MKSTIGIDLGGTKIAGVLLDGNGTVRDQLRIDTPRGRYRDTIEAIAGLVESLEREHGKGERLEVGIGTPGSMRPASEVMQNCNSVWLNGRPLKRDLEVRLARSIKLANDADCFVLSEARDGAGAGYASVFGVILGSGVGGGIVFDGLLHRGPNALSGEWGHTPLPMRLRKGGRSGNSGPDTSLKSRRCYCGKVDCVEMFLSGPGLAATHRELWGEDVSAKHIARCGSTEAHETLDVYMHMLAGALSQVVNIVDPHIIVLGGGISNVDRIYAEIVPLMEQHVFAGRCRTPVVRPRWGDASGVRGAARLCWSSGGGTGGTASCQE
ncbi:MAG: ROK family protein [Kiritimatiellia bacterium]|nr:ROK family protein [Pseudomonadales bacterium]MDP6470900.1 ROK family protein [Pseudomonadales bacterium]MDP6825915.1 ROK family protein [Pseudomonadales bacterium]MDP7024545.1 ROK family protein [Kiritimatiellia bacterium]